MKIRTIQILWLGRTEKFSTNGKTLFGKYSKLFKVIWYLACSKVWLKISEIRKKQKKYKLMKRVIFPQPKYKLFHFTKCENNLKITYLDLDLDLL